MNNRNYLISKACIFHSKLIKGNSTNHGWASTAGAD